MTTLKELLISLGTLNLEALIEGRIRDDGLLHVAPDAIAIVLPRRFGALLVYALTTKSGATHMVAAEDWQRALERSLSAETARSVPGNGLVDWNDVQLQDKSDGEPLGSCVEIRCVYFKASGKFYAMGRALHPKRRFPICFYPRQFAACLSKRGELPGLGSGTWTGPYTVEIDDSVELVLPETESE